MVLKPATDRLETWSVISTVVNFTTAILRHTYSA